MTVHRASLGIIQIVYVPALSGCPLTRTASLNAMLVAVSPGLYHRARDISAGTKVPHWVRLGTAARRCRSQVPLTGVARRCRSAPPLAGAAHRATSTAFHCG